MHDAGDGHAAAGPAKSSGRREIAVLFGLIACANAAAWGLAFAAFKTSPLQLGTAVLAYSFGLRHGLDADHIAAIDNVARKLVQEQRRPFGAGFYFSLGHSTVVWLGAIAIAQAVSAFDVDLHIFKAARGAGTFISALFLFAVAMVNIAVLAATWKELRRAKANDGHACEERHEPFDRCGLLARLFRPLFRTVRHSWHMYPLGFLFGIGFDTATEVGVLALSAAGASEGVPLGYILVFPALFTAGMSLVDTADSVLMTKAYEWAFDAPRRRLHYNVAVTAASVLIALAVAGLEALNVLGDTLGLRGRFWEGVARLNEDSAMLGIGIVAVFAGAWAASVVAHRWLGFARLEKAATVRRTAD